MLHRVLTTLALPVTTTSCACIRFLTSSTRSPRSTVEYFAAGDEQAVNASTRHRQAGFAASGRHVPVIDLGTPGYQGSWHYGSNVAGTAQIVRWFTQLQAHADGRSNSWLSASR
jgi:hypothetical protein